MKRIFLAVSMVTLFAAGAFAQGISGGVKAGLNLANFIGDDVEGADMRIAYHFGGYVNIGFSEALSLQPELLYNSVGAKSSYSEEGATVDETYKMNYISVPVSLVYSFGNFNIQAGPQISFLASAKHDMSAEFLGQSIEVSEDIKEGFKGMDLAVNLGLCASFGKLSAAARYGIGLSQLPDTDEDVKMKNGVIQLSLGYRLFGE